MAATAAAAAALLGADVVAHSPVILAARVRQEAVRSLATLSANVEGAAASTCAQAELGQKIAQLQEEFKGAADAIGPGGFTPLLLVCMAGRANDVAALLALGADPTIEGDVSTIAVPDQKYKRTPLMIAARDGHIETVTVLLAHAHIGVNQGSSDDDKTALLYACCNGQAAVVKLLLAHPEIDVNKATTAEGETPLFVACQEGHIGTVQLLLAHATVDANKAITDRGFTPLFIACQKGHAAIVKLLLAHAGIEASKASVGIGVPPLFVACQKGHPAVVKLLLAHEGVDVNKATAVGGFTPLHGAILGNTILVLQYSVVHGASVVAEDSQGRTSAQLASSQNKPELAEWLNAVSGWSQLRIAAGCRLYQEAAFLLRRGKIDPDDPATTSTKDIVAVVATATAKPATLPSRNAPELCKATSKLVADAMRGWHRTTHWLHHKAVRDAAFAVVVVAGRLEKKGSSDACADAGAAEASARMPLLPIELWLFAMRFFMRSWWEVEGVTA